MRIVLVCFVAGVAVTGLCIAWLIAWSPGARKANQVFKNLKHVQPGMSRGRVVAALAKPDTTYTRYENGDTILILHYDMGFMAPDAVRVVMQHDSVVSVTYNQ